MTIDNSGVAWRADDPADVSDYLAEYTASEVAYLATAFRAIRCPCRSIKFRVERAREVTRRVCPACKRSKFICRASGDWQEAVAEEGVERYRCTGCGSAQANITVGFAGYPEVSDLDDVKWFYVGLRCVRCGELCCYNSGKVAPGPARRCAPAASLPRGHGDARVRGRRAPGGVGDAGHALIVAVRLARGRT